MLFLLLLTCFIAYILYKHIKTVFEYPSGPLPLPYIGNIPSFIASFKKYKTAQNVYKHWKDIYGPAYTIWMGPLPTICITDYDLAVEIFVKKGSLFVDRQKFFLFDILRNGRGFINANGPGWIEQRRFALHTLRDFGMGKNLMEERIIMEFDYRASLLNADIELQGGSLEWDPYNFINLTIGNVLNSILFSERFDETREKEFFQLKDTMDKVSKNLTALDIIMKNWNKDLPFFRQRYQYMLNNLQPLFDFLEKQVEEKKKQMGDKDDHPEDFVEAFLIQMKKDDAGDSFDEGNLIVGLLDLWFAGQETTTSTLYWAFAYLLLNPTVLAKLQSEIDSITHGYKPLKLEDKKNTPYLNAVVQEVLRVSAIIPGNLFKIAAEDVSVGKYHIKKGAVVTVQLSVIMNDEKNFIEPEKFNPDRFLQGESEDFVIPFSLGKRSCIGEGLARAELFLIIGNVIRLYNLNPISGNLPKMEAEQDKGGLRTPFPYKILVSKRT